MAEFVIQSETLDNIADAINAKTGGSSAMTPAEMVTAIGNIETGGGGVQTFSGDIVLQNVNADQIVIPVDVTGKYFIASAVCVESGTVLDGTITLDEGYVTWNSESAAVILEAILLHADFFPTLRYRYKPDVTDENIQMNNEFYIHGYNGYRGTQIGLVNSNTQSSSITIPAWNAGRKFCRSGLYFKFHYEVTVW